MTIEIQIWQYLLTVLCLGGGATVFALLLNRESKRVFYWRGRALEAEARLEQIGAARRSRRGSGELCR